jgi:hypothetical protein
MPESLSSMPSETMDPIAEIKARLAKYPRSRYVETPTSIEVQPADESGFPVGLELAGSGFVVNFSGWHEHFHSRTEALNCFAFGLSADCRLCVVYRGSTPTKWIVETHKDGSWIPESETGLLVFPFWRRRRIAHLQNRLLRAK